MENSQPGQAGLRCRRHYSESAAVAVAACLGRFKGQSRIHTESDLRGYLKWCESRWLDPLTATRPHIELYVRWLQEVRRYRPSTMSRRMSLLSTAKQSTNRCDFALVAMLGPLGLRNLRGHGSDMEDLGQEHGHRVLQVRGKGDKVVLVPLPPAVGRAIERATDSPSSGPILLNRRDTRMDRRYATRRLRRLAEQAGVMLPRMHPHMLRHTFVTTMLDAGVDLRDVQIAARHADPRTTTRFDRARRNLDRYLNYISLQASGT